MSGEGESHGQTGERYICHTLIGLIVWLHPPGTTLKDKLHTDGQRAVTSKKILSILELDFSPDIIISTGTTAVKH